MVRVPRATQRRRDMASQLPAAAASRSPLLLSLCALYWLCATGRCASERVDRRFVLLRDYNAVPDGRYADESSLSDCEAKCTGPFALNPASSRLLSVCRSDGKVPVHVVPSSHKRDSCVCTTGTGTCLQFAWNEHSHHCFLSNAQSLGGRGSDHVVSGCVPELVSGCNGTNSSGPLPHWSVPQ